MLDNKLLIAHSGYTGVALVHTKGLGYLCKGSRPCAFLRPTIFVVMGRSSHLLELSGR